jgi:NAD(P)-dependent dehydrogenase (short-subunit alcohol dehydrogenase family)
VPYADCVRPVAEQTILVTGATDGLGKALALELASQGATLLLHGRDDAKGERVLGEIRAATGNERLGWLRADLASLDQVRGLGELVLGETDRLDVLVNNAGIGTTTDGVQEREESREGFELRFAVNYLAGFLLTRLLLGRLEGSAPSRIVNVSSAGQAPIDFDDVMLTRRYSGVQAYCQSKLAQIMFTFDLAAELGERGVSANCLHPATYMPTKMVLSGGIEPYSTLEQGTQATLRLIVADELDGVSGRYFNGLYEERPNAQAEDPQARARLRELSDGLCGLAPV